MANCEHCGYDGDAMGDELQDLRVLRDKQATVIDAQHDALDDIDTITAKGLKLR
jgi:hypothetical protein